MWNDFQQNPQSEFDRRDRRLLEHPGEAVLAALHNLELQSFVQGDPFGDGARFRLTPAGRAKAHSLAAAKLGAMWALASLL